MSQKTTRRRRQTTDEDLPSFKAPTPKPNGTEETLSEEKDSEEKPVEEPTNPPPPPPSEEPANEKEKEVTENENGVVTRSRSATPQVKKVNGVEESSSENELKNEEETEEEKNDKNEEVEVASTDLEPDPSIATDEPYPELVFEENSDLESGKGSPVLSRCKTRRSQTRNLPTPKTPKSFDEQEEMDALDASFESCPDDVSTKAEVGGDTTRMNYTDKESSLESNSFLQEAKSKSFGETLRHLSTRRTIRPISADYRKRLLQNNLGKNDYPSRNSVESVSSVGLKRKASEEDNECSKRFKGDFREFLASFTSPLERFRFSRKADIASSTPKLTGYKDETCLLEDGITSKLCEVKDGERRWCSIM